MAAKERFIGLKIVKSIAYVSMLAGCGYVNGRSSMGVFRLRKLIPVRYIDGHVDKIPSLLLNTLIETHQIIEFKRKEGWVVVGSDAVRGTNHGQLHDRERRWN
jgi:hypothetical protein